MNNIKNMIVLKLGNLTLSATSLTSFGFNGINFSISGVDMLAAIVPVPSLISIIAHDLFIESHVLMHGTSYVVVQV